MKASIIICTYNEEKTIADVTAACCKLNPDCEIIVVDDGSTDNTESILKELCNEYSFSYHRLEKNMGKGWAMVQGVEVSRHEIVLFFDADVSNIKKEHFDALLNPLISNESDMVLGQPSETLIDYRVNPFKPLTGQRALWKENIIPILKDLRNIRFGVETYINLYYQAQGKRIKYVLLEGLKHPTKYAKTTPVKATKEFIKEGHEIALTMVENYNLIAQRIGLQFSKANAKTVKSINELQDDINVRIKGFSTKFDRFLTD